VIAPELGLIAPDRKRKTPGMAGASRAFCGFYRSQGPVAGSGQTVSAAGICSIAGWATG
jgi:hypothetical protein